MSAAAPRVGVVGGGIMGSVIALRLARAGASVTLLERGRALGGLAATMDFDGHRVDRFYHVITPADARMIALARETGLGDALRFASAGAGFYVDGALHDLNGLRDFARFAPLTPWQRARLAWFVAWCQLRAGCAGLEDVALLDWLSRHCGPAVTQRIWKPLLDSRFDGRHEELPATYLWARTRRMSGARSRRERGEVYGHVVGGHQRLIDAVGERAREHGAEVRLEADVRALAADGDGVRGVVVGDEELRFDLVIVTLAPPALAALLPAALGGLVAPYPRRYLGVVCLVMKLPRPLLPYYALNICEPTPITTIVETSHVLGTDHTGGLRLVYVPKYCAPDAAEQSLADEAVFERFIGMVEQIVPSFCRDEVAAWTVQRARLVEPVHARGARPRLAPVWPAVPGLGLASTAQVYPRLLNGDSMVSLAEDVAAQARVRLGLDSRRP